MIGWSRCRMIGWSMCGRIGGRICRRIGRRICRRIGRRICRRICRRIGRRIGRRVFVAVYRVWPGTDRSQGRLVPAVEAEGPAVPTGARRTGRTGLQTGSGGGALPVLTAVVLMYVVVLSEVREEVLAVRHEAPVIRTVGIERWRGAGQQPGLSLALLAQAGRQ